MNLKPISHFISVHDLVNSMEFELSNTSSKGWPSMGEISYFSSHKYLIQKKKYTKRRLKKLIKEDLVDPKKRGVFYFEDRFNKFQLFDIDILLHIQNMADQYLFYGEDLEENLGKGVKDNRRTFHGKNFSIVYKGTIFFKDRMQVSRNKFFNITFNLVDDDEEEIHCQMYYSGENIYSDSLRQRVSFPLKKFLRFLRENKRILHMYRDPANSIDYRKPINNKNYIYETILQPPKNLYDLFLESNQIMHEI